MHLVKLTWSKGRAQNSTSSEFRTCKWEVNAYV